MRCISSLEYAELVAFSRLERVGLERTDLYAAAASMNDPDAFCFEPEPEVSDDDLFAGFTSLVVSNTGVAYGGQGTVGVNRQRGAKSQAGDAQRAATEGSLAKGQQDSAEASS